MHNACHILKNESCHNVEPMALKVSELIKMLREFPPDAEVYTEGCDCSDEAMDVDYEKLVNRVEITRNVVDRTPPKPPEPEPPNTGPPSKRWGG